MQIHSDYILTDYNTFALPTHAAYFIECHSEADLMLLTRDEFFQSQPHLFVGRGSNLLFINDYNGCIVRYVSNDLTIVDEDDKHVILSVDAGYLWHDLVQETVTKGWWGLENLALIPGDVGAAAVQNIGAYGAEIKDVIEEVHTIDLHDGQAHLFTRDDCQYAYRHSIFKEESHRDYFVYRVTLRLSKIPCPNLSYAGLRSHLDDADKLTPEMIMRQVMTIRENKLPDPKVLPNAGSFFMNPVIDHDRFESLRLSYPTIPHYPMGQRVKVPAAWLIEQCGLKGKRYGAVGCYEQQPLVIVKYDSASGEDIRKHAERVQHAVKEQFDITLIPEVKFIISEQPNNPSHKSH